MVVIRDEFCPKNHRCPVQNRCPVNAIHQSTPFSAPVIMKKSVQIVVCVQKCVRCL